MIYGQVEESGEAHLLRSLRPSDAEAIAEHWLQLKASNRSHEIGLDPEKIPDRTEIMAFVQNLARQDDHAFNDSWTIVIQNSSGIVLMVHTTRIVNGEKAELQLVPFGDQAQKLKQSFIALLALVYDMFKLKETEIPVYKNDQCLHSLLGLLSLTCIESRQQFPEDARIAGYYDVFRLSADQLAALRQT